MHSPADFFPLAGAVQPRDEDVGADRQPDEGVDDQIRQRAGRADRRQRLISGILPDDREVGGVEKQL